MQSLKIAHANNGKTFNVNLDSWKKQVIDNRDLLYSIKLNGLYTSRPSAYDLRSYCSSIEDQGNLGSCTSQMVAGLIELNENHRRLGINVAVASPQVAVSQIQSDNSGVISYLTTVTPPVSPSPSPAPAPSTFIDVSRLFEYYATRKIQGTINTDSGASNRDSIKAAASYGVVDEKLWPYDINKFKVNPPTNVWTEAVKHKITSYHAITEGDIETMKCSVASGFGVGFGFAVYTYFLTSDMAKKGLLCLPKGTESLQGYHAVCIVGYDDDKVMPDGSKSAFLVRNSWGKTWGLEGYFWVSCNYLANTRLAFDFWVVQSSPF